VVRVDGEPAVVVEVEAKVVDRTLGGGGAIGRFPNTSDDGDT
jgi:hypothetical protein